MTIRELQARQRELQSQMAEIMGNAERAEDFAALEREFKSNSREINMMIQQAQAAALENREERNPGAILRETLQGVRNGRHDREVTLGTEINNSGAVNLTIHDVIDTTVEGTGLPAQLSIVRGVVGKKSIL